MKSGNNTLSNYRVAGYHIQRGVISDEEAGCWAEHYMKLNAEGPHPGDFSGVRPASANGQAEPLAAYPRLIQMHDWDASSASFMNDPRIKSTAELLTGQPVDVLQTMVYFKPAGSRGQSFHQDNLYLRCTPVIAAWVALDDCDAENGAMEMVDGSHLLGLLPCKLADTDLSFTDSETVFPDYLPKTLISLKRGDAVFFGGLTVHGSMPNRSVTRFRRAFIVHYQGRLNYPIVGPPLPRSGAT